MKLKSNQKSHNKKTVVTNLKSSTKEIIYTIILIINFFSLFAKLNQNILFNLTEVTLKVKGVGNIKILSDYFFQRYNQCEIYINGILQNITSNEYYLNHTENEDIELSNNITYLNNTQNIDLSTSKNEYNYSNISEIDEYSEISKLGKHYTERIKSVMFTNEELFIDFENQSSYIFRNEYHSTNLSRENLDVNKDTYFTNDLEEINNSNDTSYINNNEKFNSVRKVLVNIHII